MAMPVLAQPKGGALMAKDVFTPIAQGYDFVREGNYEAAKNEFNKAVKADRHTPFALNNLAVLDEREGKLNDAFAHLKDATTEADAYFDKVTQILCDDKKALSTIRQHGDNGAIVRVTKDNDMAFGVLMPMRVGDIYSPYAMRPQWVDTPQVKPMLKAA
jgi:tetratricopeptide (TPR) repeat protein